MVIVVELLNFPLDNVYQHGSHLTVLDALTVTSGADEVGIDDAAFISFIADNQSGTASGAVNAAFQKMRMLPRALTVKVRSQDHLYLVPNLGRYDWLMSSSLLHPLISSYAFVVGINQDFILGIKQ